MYIYLLACMSERCMCIEYVNILVFISLCIFASVSVCRSYVMSYCALGRACICPSANTSVSPLAVYPSTYITVRHGTVMRCLSAFRKT